MLSPHQFFFKKPHCTRVRRYKSLPAQSLIGGAGRHIYSSQACIDPSNFFSFAQNNSPVETKTRSKFAGTDVALPKSHNVEIAPKGGELDRNGTTSATVFTLRLSVMLPSLKKSAALASLSAIGKAKPRKCFGDAMQNSQLANRFVMGHPAHAVPLAVKEETT